MLDRSPCLLKSRARGFYVSTLGRRMSIAEMCAFQGFPSLKADTISTAALGGMLGNAMSLNVVVRVVADALPSMGFDIPCFLLILGRSSQSRLDMTLIQSAADGRVTLTS